MENNELNAKSEVDPSVNQQPVVENTDQDKSNPEEIEGTTQPDAAKEIPAVIVVTPVVESAIENTTVQEFSFAANQRYDISLVSFTGSKAFFYMEIDNEPAEVNYVTTDATFIEKLQQLQNGGILKQDKELVMSVVTFGNGVDPITMKLFTLQGVL